jgi:hypothetical protein
MRLIVESRRIPQPLRPIIDTLGEEYAIAFGTRAAGAGELNVTFAPGAAAGAVEVTVRGRTATIAYDQPAHACRGLGALLAGLVKPGHAHREQTSFRTFGIMLDCSRNAVMTAGHFQKWLRRLALLGYNMAMLYTEDTYELPGEDYFGYRRGRYSAAELRAIDRYAARLGIEMVGCIQTLGHLEQLLRWPEYGELKDTASVLMVGEAGTYALIEKMIAAFARHYRSRRLHIGMDEAFGLGRGRYMDRHGYQRAFDIFNQHLQRVTAICKRHGLHPMLWSDMYFCMGSKTGAYYDKRCRIPADVKRGIPRDAQLVYWEYSAQDAAQYRDMIRRHRRLGKEPVMAACVDTVQRLWVAPPSAIAPCMEACRAEGVREFVVTLWGDDGAYCEFDSALAGLVHAAELAYGGPATAGRLGRRFGAICGADYAAVMTAAAMHDARRSHMKLLWDDPLLRVAWTNERLRDAATWREMDVRFATLLRRLRRHANVTQPVDLAHAVRLLRFLRVKIRLNEELDAAYARRDIAALRRVRARLPAVLGALDELLASFRRQWHRRNKPFGFETIQYRLGGERQRYLELSQRLGEVIAGQATDIPEWDEHPRHPSRWTHAAWRYLTVSGTV